VYLQTSFQAPELSHGENSDLVFSDRSRGVTGEVHYVDSGYRIVGMKRADAPDISLASVRLRMSNSPN
jgi:enoyl-[acyl-carrier-protein] reductase (NADH)